MHNKIINCESLLLNYSVFFTFHMRYFQNIRDVFATTFLRFPNVLYITRILPFSLFLIIVLIIATNYRDTFRIFFVMKGQIITDSYRYEQISKIFRDARSTYSSLSFMSFSGRLLFPHCKVPWLTSLDGLLLHFPHWMAHGCHGCSPYFACKPYIT